MLRKLSLTALWLIPLLGATGCPAPSSSAGIDFQNPLGGGDDGGVEFPAPSTDFEAVLRQQFPECGEPDDAAEIRSTILDLVNQVRANEGLAPLSTNRLLQDQASQYACEMIDGEFFGHVNPRTGSTLSTRANDFGYEYFIVGENLAAGQPTPEQAFADWMESPGHRANILDERFTEIGIGVRVGGDYGIYYVQEFGHPTD